LQNANHRLTPALRAPQRFLRSTAAARNEPRDCRTQNAVTFPSAGANPAQCEKRNKWQGPAPPGGKDAVYVGFDLEPAQRSATRLESANNLATQNSEEPKFYTIPARACANDLEGRSEESRFATCQVAKCSVAICNKWFETWM